MQENQEMSIPLWQHEQIAGSYFNEIKRLEKVIEDLRREIRINSLFMEAYTNEYEKLKYEVKDRDEYIKNLLNISIWDNIKRIWWRKFNA